MSKRIIYKNENGIAVIIPADCNLTIEQIAQKDVPAGIPYLIVETSEIPLDRTFREAWEVDFSQPNGYGLGAEDFSKHQEGQG